MSWYLANEEEEVGVARGGKWNTSKCRKKMYIISNLQQHCFCGEKTYFLLLAKYFGLPYFSTCCGYMTFTVFCVSFDS